MDRQIKKLQKRLQKDIMIIYPTVAHVMWTDYGWRKSRIMNLFKLTQEIWEECSTHGADKSMIQMLDEETGIEIGVPGKKSYKDLPYLNGDAWDGRPPTKEQMIYIRQQEAIWVAPSIIACFCLALHRRYGWRSTRIGHFVETVQTVRFQRGTNPKNYRSLLTEKGFELSELTDRTL